MWMNFQRWENSERVGKSCYRGITVIFWNTILAYEKPLFTSFEQKNKIKIK